MSARQWRERLIETQEKLTQSITAANEWKLVAENRLDIIHKLDDAVKKQLSALETVGEIFGVKVDLDHNVWTKTEGMDAGGTAMYIMGKIEATAIYLRNLMGEASQIQMTLRDTYQIASEAVAVSRPVTDLSIPPDLSLTDLPSSPLSSLSESINDLPIQDGVTVAPVIKAVSSPPRKLLKEGPSSALAMFK